MTDAQAARSAICRAAQELAGATVGILFEPDPKGQELVSTAVAGAATEPIHLPFAGSPSGATTAFASGQPFFVADLADHPAVTQRVADRLGVVSALWQPVLRNGVPIGVLTLVIIFDVVDLRTAADITLAFGILAMIGAALAIVSKASSCVTAIVTRERAVGARPMSAICAS